MSGGGLCKVTESMGSMVEWSGVLGEQNARMIFLTTSDLVPV